MDLLTTYTHDLELQVITALPLISTIHKSLEHPLSLFQPSVSSPAVPWQRLLIVEIFQFHILTSQPPIGTHSLTCLDYNISAQINKKQLFYSCPNPFHGSIFCLRRCYPVTALVYMLISRSLSSNGSTLYNIL
jgi:hypothetical protein